MKVDIVSLNVFMRFAQWLCSKPGKQIVQNLKRVGIEVLAPKPCKHSNIKFVSIRGKTNFPKEELEIFLSNHGYYLAKKTTKRTAIIICNNANPKTANKHAKILPDTLLVFKLLNGYPVDVKYDSSNENIVLSERLVWELAVQNAIKMEQCRELF